MILDDRVPAGYLACVDVFPTDLNERCLASLGKARKVHFAKAHGKLTKTESLLAENDVYACREQLDRIDAPVRSVLFAPFKYRLVPRHTAYSLAKRSIAAGCTLRACADGIGYHFNSIVQWKIRKGTRALFMPPGSSEDHARYSAAGIAHCATLEGQQDRAPTAAHYVWVGWVLEQVEQELEAVRRNVAHLAQVGGPTDAAVCIYRLPRPAVEAMAPAWTSTRVMDPPTRDMVELARLEKVARAYCKRQQIPLRTPRLLAWVGWFLEYTDIEEAPRQKGEV